VRALFLLLLLANLLFAGWSLWVAPTQPATHPATPGATGPGSIRLLSEVPPQPPPADADLAVLADADLACVSAGPYLDRGEAERAAARLGALGFTVGLRDGQEEVRVGQWVRIEGLATPEDAANVQAALQAAGLTEAFVVTDEQAGTVVSLGVHSDASRADATVAAARRAGFEPKVVDALRSSDVVWLDVNRQASGGLPAPEQLQPAEPGRTAEFVLRPCPADAAPVDAAPASPPDAGAVSGQAGPAPAGSGTAVAEAPAAEPQVVLPPAARR